MNVKVENVEKNVMRLEIEVDAEKFREGLQKSFLKNAKKFNIPGFRKGKAPRAIVERYYGEEVLYEDALDFICPEAYEKAVKEQDIHPVSRPEIDIKQIGGGQNLIFTATVTTKPEVELGAYKGLEVPRIDIVVTEDDVENELKKALERNARIITVEDRAVQSGDTVVIDYEGFLDGEAFDGGKVTGYSLEIGSGQFIPGFEDQLIGANKGDETEVKVTFPEDYGIQELAGKEALFKVKVNKIKVKELPVADDEFAKDVSEFDTLEEYKEDLRKKLVENAEHRARHETEDKVIAKAVENAQVDIPQVMIEKRVDSIMLDFDRRLRYQGLDLEKYLQAMHIDMADFRGQYAERAQNEVKTLLVMEKISQVEEIRCTDEELDAEIEKMGKIYRQSGEEFKKHLKEDDIEYIKSDIVMRKTVDFLVENAVRI